MSEQGSAHLYRDALRWRGMPAAGAWILVPCLRPKAAMYGTDDYHRAQRLGAIETEGDGAWASLETWLGQHMPPP